MQSKTSELRNLFDSVGFCGLHYRLFCSANEDIDSATRDFILRTKNLKKSKSSPSLMNKIELNACTLVLA